MKALRYLFVLILSAGVASFCAGVLSFFAKDPAHAVRTGFGPTEFEMLPWIIFFIMTGILSKVIGKK